MGSVGWKNLLVNFNKFKEAKPIRADSLKNQRVYEAKSESKKAVSF